MQYKAVRCGESFENLSLWSCISYFIILYNFVIYYSFYSMFVQLRHIVTIANWIMCNSHRPVLLFAQPFSTVNNLIMIIIVALAPYFGFVSFLPACVCQCVATVQCGALLCMLFLLVSWQVSTGIMYQQVKWKWWHVCSLTVCCYCWNHSGFLHTAMLIILVIMHNTDFNWSCLLEITLWYFCRLEYGLCMKQLTMSFWFLCSHGLYLLTYA